MENKQTDNKQTEKIESEYRELSYPTGCTIWIEGFSRIKILARKVAELESIVNELLEREN